MKLQVPYKGMEIDLSDDKVELSSALMLLLLDGYDIALKGYSDSNLGIQESKEYRFHKYDYQSKCQNESISKSENVHL